MIGVVDALDAHPGVCQGQPLAVNGFVFRYDAGQRAQTCCDTGRGGVEAVRQRLHKHCGVEFPGLAIDVEIGAGKMGAQQGRAKVGRTGKQLVHKGILRLADGQVVKSRHG